MATTLSAVFVTHRSSAVLSRAVDSFRAQASAAGLAAEVVVVEQSEDDRERQEVESCRPERLLVRPNHGYAAGVNAGLAAAGGEVVLVGNPDVELRPGALAALLEALAAGWEVVGPQFTLGGFRFPPAEDPTPGQELRRWRAGAGPRAFRAFFTREMRRCDRLWQASEPVPMPTLSGALLAFRREVADRVGPWDEGYFLYFEETDWLRRARRRGCRLAQVPRAEVEHVWGHAAEPATWGEHHARSRERFLARHFRLPGRLVRALAPRPLPLPRPSWGAAHAGSQAQGRLWLLSPSAAGFPAALLTSGERPEAAAARVLQTLGRPRELTLLAFDPSRRRLLGAWRWPG